MGDTFGGEHRRLGSNGRDPQRGNNRRQLADRASYDHEAVPGCWLIACLMICAAIITALA